MDTGTAETTETTETMEAIAVTDEKGTEEMEQVTEAEAKDVSVAGVRQSAESAKQEEIRKAVEEQRSKEERAAEALLKANDGGDHWGLADALLDAVPMKTTNDIGNAFDRVTEKARSLAGVTFKGWSRNTMRQYRDTANAWKPADRIVGVSFSAHKEANALADKERVLGDLARNGDATVVAVKRLNRVAAGKPAMAVKAVEEVDHIQALFDSLSFAKTDKVRQWLRSQSSTVIAIEVKKWEERLQVLSNELGKEKSRRAALGITTKQEREAASKQTAQQAKAKASIAAKKAEAVSKPAVAKKPVGSSVGDIRGL